LPPHASRLLPDSLLFKPWLFAGSCYYNMNNLDSAAYYFNLAERLLSRYPGMAESERLFNKIGAVYFETGDYRASITYFSKALSLAERRKSPDMAFIVNYKNNLASARRKLHDYATAIELYKSLLPLHINQDGLLHNIGATCLAAGQYTEAIRYLQQVSYNNQIKYNDLGLAYLLLQKYDSAALFLARAVSACEKRKDAGKNLDNGITLSYSGDLALATGHFDKALVYYHKAVLQLDQDFNDSTPASNPASFRGLHNSFYLFNALTGKARACRQLFYLPGGDPYGRQAFNSYAAAILLAEQVSGNYHSDEAKLFLREKVNATCQEAVDLGIRLYEKTKDRFYFTQSFRLAESNKAAVLQSGLRHLDIESVAGLPPAL
ncbi:MAG TPA: tetratricopeptide repeat protein, partial [Chitinophagaceae bacterium]|nr:tetratricopeptide repeat protein [Chitinophagaceae bacterium]